MALFENPAWPPAGRAMCWRGTIGSLLAQGLTPFAAAAARRLPPRAGRRRRSASGSATPACWPATCRRVSPSPAGGCRRSPSDQAGDKRLGFGAASRRDRRSAWTARVWRARRTGSRRGLAAAGLPPLPWMAWLELDLDALVGNLATLAPWPAVAPVHPVVKADAYGHGAVPIARASSRGRRRRLSVATMDEALELREAESPADPRAVSDPTRPTARRCGTRSRSRSATAEARGAPGGGRGVATARAAARRDRGRDRVGPGRRRRRRSWRWRTRSRRRPRRGSPGSGRTCRRARTRRRGPAEQCGRFDEASDALAATADVRAATSRRAAAS